MKTTTPLTSRGFALDMSLDSFGELRRSSDVLGDTEELRRRRLEDGYLYLPGFFPRDDVAAARNEFVSRLRDLNALDPDYPVEQAIAAKNLPPNIARAVVRENAPLRDVVFSTRLLKFYEKLLGSDVRHYDHIWTRVVAPGEGTAPHCDLVYMGRGTHDVMTAWIPYGDVSLDLGGLMLLEKSHTQTERLRKYLASDVDTYCENRGPYKHKSGLLSSNPASLREKMGGRWLTAEFRMGDLLTFGMKLVHASLDNQTRAFRMSSDSRYQLASEPIDERWVGPDTEEYSERNRIGKIC